MKIRVTEEQIKNIEKFKKYVLMDNRGHIYVIQEYTITEEIKKPWFGEPRTPHEIRKYLTDAVVQCYIAEGDFQGQLIGQSLETFFLQTSFEKMRTNWRVFAKELLSFGFTIVRTPKEDDTMKTAAQDYLKTYFPKGYSNQEDIINFAVAFAKLQINNK